MEGIFAALSCQLFEILAMAVGLPRSAGRVISASPDWIFVEALGMRMPTAPTPQGPQVPLAPALLERRWRFLGFAGPGLLFETLGSGSICLDRAFALDSGQVLVTALIAPVADPAGVLFVMLSDQAGLAVVGRVEAAGGGCCNRIHQPLV